MLLRSGLEVAPDFDKVVLILSHQDIDGQRYYEAFLEYPVIEQFFHWVAACDVPPQMIRDYEVIISSTSDSMEWECTPEHLKNYEFKEEPSMNEQLMQDDEIIASSFEYTAIREEEESIKEEPIYFDIQEVKIEYLPEEMSFKEEELSLHASGTILTPSPHPSIFERLISDASIPQKRRVSLLNGCLFVFLVELIFLFLE